MYMHVLASIQAVYVLWKMKLYEAVITAKLVSIGYFIVKNTIIFVFYNYLKTRMHL